MKKKIIISVISAIVFFIFVVLMKIVYDDIIKNPIQYNNIRLLLEMLSYITSPLILLAALIGLIQLRFAQRQIKTMQDQITVEKETFKLQTIRESFQISANECRIFSEKIMPVIVQIDKFIEENKITILDDISLLETDKGFTVNLSKVKDDQVQLLKKIEDELRIYFNGMELFALLFTSRVANNKIGFLTMGSVFVIEVERMAKLLPLCNATQDDCKAIWPLYFDWKKRLQKLKLEKEISERESKLATITIENKKPIGAE